MCELQTKAAFKPTGGSYMNNFQWIGPLTASSLRNDIKTLVHKFQSEADALRSTSQSEPKLVQNNPPTELRSALQRTLTFDDRALTRTRGAAAVLIQNHSRPHWNTLWFCRDEDRQCCLPSSARAPFITLFPSKRHVVIVNQTFWSAVPLFANFLQLV